MHVVRINIGPSPRRTEITIDGQPTKVAALGLAISTEEAGPPRVLIELRAEVKVRGWAEVIEPTIIEQCALTAEAAAGREEAQPGSRWSFFNLSRARCWLVNYRAC